jgi:hypothetical protein
MEDLMNIIGSCKQKTLFIVLAILAKEIEKLKDKNKVWYYF